MLDPITLKTVRPFVIDNVVLSHEEVENGVKLKNKAEVNKFLKSNVEELIERAKAEWEERFKDEEEECEREMMLPLIRLKVTSCWMV